MARVVDPESAVAHASANSAIEGVEFDGDWLGVLRARGAKI